MASDDPLAAPSIWRTPSDSQQRTKPQSRLRRQTSMLLPVLIAIIILLPVGYLVRELLTPNIDLWQQMWDTFLPNMVENTIILTVGVGVGSLVLGVSFAWLTSMYDFPLRAIFDHALLLPLAIPSFIMGFIFMATFDFAGPVQTQLRAWFGDSAPSIPIRSAGGLIIVMTLVLYPYVYILARAAFREQAASTFEAARVMGYSRTQTFFRLVMPLARPSIVAGVTLAMMEAMTDYGTVAFFSFPTLSEGIVRLWNVRFDRETATELASLLLMFALGMILLEWALRGRAKYYQQGGSRGKRPARQMLRGWKRWFAVSACLGLLSVAFILPATQLIVWSVKEIDSPTVGGWDTAIYMDYVWNTVRLSGVAAGLIIGMSVVVAHGTRSNSLTGRRPLARLISRFVTLGYAMPGAVVAVGVLLLVAPIDHQVTDWVEENLGRTDRSLLFTGTMTGLIYAYLVRYMSVGFSSVDSSFQKVTPTMEQAARTMGARSWRVLWRIYVPLLSTGMAAGAILVFVDVMKEIPATLLLRPFGMDTLALWTYFLAMEAFWQAAAIPSLTILVVGLLPVLLLMRVGDRGAQDRAS